MRDLAILRDFQLPGRSAAYGVNGMAATAHPLASLTAIDVLREGGNAIDAAVAAVAVLCVVEPAQTGIGGDCFALVAPASGGVVALDGSGRLPAAASLERLRALGLGPAGGIPGDSAHAVTIPGAVAGWALLLERHGTMGLDRLLRPAIKAAADGVPAGGRIAFDAWRETPRLTRATARAIYCPGGQPPTPGQVLRFPALARTLQHLADRGARAFYEGPLAQAMVATLRAEGGLQDEADFAGAAATLAQPIQTAYRDTLVYQCPPAGQGIVALQLLNILEGFDLKALAQAGPERHHLMAEAAKLAFRDRDLLLAERGAEGAAIWARLLDKGYAAQLRERIDPERVMADLPPPLVEPHPETTYVSVVDRDLNACSLINSIYDSYGSGIASETTGVLFQNRGRAFRLDPAHPNVAAPGKRPLHTIIPGMAFKDGQAWLSYGVMGGDFQPVGHALLLGNLIDHGLGLQAAVDAPRSMAWPVDMVVERGLPPATRAGLQLRGHAIHEAATPMGGGQAVMIDRRRGVLVGASEPRKDGIALGY